MGQRINVSPRGSSFTSPPPSLTYLAKGGARIEYQGKYRASRKEEMQLITILPLDLDPFIRNSMGNSRKSQKLYDCISVLIKLELSNKKTNGAGIIKLPFS